jgi:hypothetical protein
MHHSTLLALLLANPFAPQHPELLRLLADHAQLLGQLLLAFLAQDTTPQATADLEHDVAQRLRRLGRALLEWTANHIEPADATALPRRLVYQGQTYRRRGCHPHTVATLFGPICVQRYLYEPLEPGERCVHPLHRQLGLVADYATPALAQRLAQYTVSQPQRAVLDTLQRDHDVTCSPATLRKVVGAVAAGLEPHAHAARTDRVLALLTQAQASRGKQRVVLAVGRDGIQVPVVGSPTYHEASTATVTVFDRRGQRVGTVYLGRMPEAQQVTLSQQLTDLLTAVLHRWDKTRPRLAYITDGGWHPSDYFARVLRSMPDPQQPGAVLAWERIVDFYHAAQYVTQLAEALFGATARARAWARQMRQRLKEARGVTRLLQAASWHRGGLRLSAARVEAYRKAYQYLSGHRRWMDYARYRREGLPLGSGITEAGCKVLFTQRLKQSGMKWKAAGGQVIVTLRSLWLSGVWDQVFRVFRAAQTPQSERSNATQDVEQQEKAA